MMKRMVKWILVIHILPLIASLGRPQYNALAQMRSINRPIDMMIIVDNSGSMYGATGNDPDQLRVTGADIFIARLGFGEANESDYQAGVISMGGEPEMIAPLQPLSGGARGSLARAIANPENAGGTHIVHALEMAYQELRTSNTRKPGNLQAVILLTDGVPDPPEGQSRADIEQLITENPDIPLFTMLLQNKVGGISTEYQAYMDFWRQLETRHTHLFTYQIEDAGQIENTYNEIVAQLQNTVPSEGFMLAPNEPVNIFVGRYVHRLFVTIVHDAAAERGQVIIRDPTDTQVTDKDPDVRHFDDPDNPAEVIAIGPDRIGTLVDDVWTIESDSPVYVFLDRQGAYRFNFESPDVSLTDVTNVYLAISRCSPSDELVIRFSLLDNEDNPVTDPQPIHGMVTHPDGSNAELRIPANVNPDAQGVYEIRYDYSTYPQALDERGRYTFVLEAGRAGDREGERIPVTIAKLLVDVGRGAYIRTVEPAPLICEEGKPAVVTATLGDCDTADMSTAQLRIFGGGVDVELTPSGADTFAGDVSALCGPLLSGIDCSSTNDTVFRARLVAQSPDGSILPPSEREIPVHVLAPTCTPLPTPTHTPTPSPPPTPIPDSDKDGWKDPQDACPSDPGQIAAFRGCPPPLWFWGLLGGSALALLAFFVFWLWPFIKTRTFAPPPDGYVLVCETGARRHNPISVRDIGLKKRKSKVTIGSHNKDDIRVKGLKPKEFIVEQQGDRVVLLDARGMRKGRFIERGAHTVHTSNANITLRIGMDPGIRC